MDDSVELLEQSKTGQTSSLESLNNDWTSTSSTLPARTLPLRSTIHIIRCAFWKGLVTVVIVIGLSVLASDIPRFLVSTESADLLSKSISCDLQVRSGSSVQGVFIVNMRGATHLTFTQAKAIDVVWQLFVGAGGRFVMAWVAYKVFMDGLTRQLERTPVSYRVYASMTFDTNSLFSVWYALTAVYYSRGWQSKTFLAWFCLSTVYILGFPTLISATAGYLTPSIAGFKMSDNTFLTSDSSILTSCFNVSGGALIGLQNGTIVQGPPVHIYNVVIPWDNGGDLANIPEEIQQAYPRFYDLLNLTIHKPPRIYDATNTTKPFPPKDYTLDSRMDLNFTTNFTLDGHFYLFHNYDFFRDSGIPSPGMTSSYCYNNGTLSQDFLEAAAECLPENYFVWGFSSLLVYIVLCLQITWTLGIYLVWLDANIYSALCRSGRKVRGHYRAAIDLSEAMGELLGKETCTYSDAELSRELQRQSGIRYYSTDAQSEDVSHIGLSSRRVGRVEFDSTKLYGKHTSDR